jgi:hypothetical protein
MPTTFGELSIGSPRRRIAAMSEAAISNAPLCFSSVLSFGSGTARAIYQIRLLFATRKVYNSPVSGRQFNQALSRSPAGAEFLRTELR